MSEFLIPLAVIATIAYSVSAVTIKILIHEIKNPLHLLLYQISINFFLILLIACLYLLIYQYPALNLTIMNVFLISLSSVLVFIGVLFLYQGFNVGNTSVGSLILSSKVIVSVLLAIILLAEHYAPIIYVLIALIFVGIILTSWQENLNILESLRSSGTFYFIGTILLLGMGNVIIGYLNNEVFFITFLLIRLAIMNLLLFLLYPKLNRDILGGKSFTFSYRHFLYVTIFVIIAGIGDAATIVALGESVTITESIGSFQGVISFCIIIILSLNSSLRSIYNEPMNKKTLVVRFFGILVATSAVIGLILSI